MRDGSLNRKIEAGEFITAPGVQDMIAAVLARDIGFDAVYGSGYWLTASALGLPDAGIVSVTQMTDRMERLVETAKTPVIADADTGFGGLLNVHHTVKGYERIGVSAIQIEDQEFPKKCGHTPNKRVTSTEQMVDKIKVAVDARTDERLLVIARTDVFQSQGMSAVIDRLGAFSDAGADILFPEALTTIEDMRLACQTFDKPMLANMADGGKTPILSAAELEDLGYAAAIFPSMTSLVAIHAMERALLELKASGSSKGAEVYDFEKFCGQIGFKEVWEFDAKWARTAPDA